MACRHFFSLFSPLSSGTTVLLFRESGPRPHTPCPPPVGGLIGSPGCSGVRPSGKRRNEGDHQYTITDRAGRMMMAVKSFLVDVILTDGVTLRFLFKRLVYRSDRLSLLSLHIHSQPGFNPFSS